MSGTLPSFSPTSSARRVLWLRRQRGNLVIVFVEHTDAAVGRRRARNGNRFAFAGKKPAGRYAQRERDASDGHRGHAPDRVGPHELTDRWLRNAGDRREVGLRLDSKARPLELKGQFHAAW